MAAKSPRAIDRDGTIQLPPTARTVGSLKYSASERSAIPPVGSSRKPGKGAASAFTAGTPAGDRLAAADPDKDGIINLMEYALNTNPSAASASPAPEVVTVGAEKFLQIRWTRPNDRTDITTAGQVSTDLTPSLNWVTGAGNVTTTITPAGAGLEEVIIRSAQAIGSGPRRFLRAKVTQL